MVGTFSFEDIMDANQRHDIRYGWSPSMSRDYTNLGRLPEYFATLPGAQCDDDVWAAVDKQRDMLKMTL